MRKINRFVFLERFLIKYKDLFSLDYGIFLSLDYKMFFGFWDLNKGFFLISFWLEYVFKNESVIKDRFI